MIIREEAIYLLCFIFHLIPSITLSAEMRDALAWFSPKRISFKVIDFYGACRSLLKLWFMQIFHSSLSVFVCNSSLNFTALKCWKTQWLCYFVKISSLSRCKWRDCIHFSWVNNLFKAKTLNLNREISSLSSDLTDFFWRLGEVNKFALAKRFWVVIHVCRFVSVSGA